MDSQKSYLTNSFDKSKFSVYSTIASNERAKLEKTSDGRICVVIDGVRYSAKTYDLFGMTDNPTQWLEAFVKEYDKETKKEELNAPHKKQISYIETKMAENTQEAKESRTIQERIKKAILNANIALSSFLKECGVRLRSSLSGAERQQADKLNNDYWAQRFALTSENNNELALLFENNRLAYSKGKEVREVTFNNISLER